MILVQFAFIAPWRNILNIELLIMRDYLIYLHN